MRVALDTQCSKRLEQMLNESGFEVVIRANDEMDEDWVSTGLAQGADIFVSPDLDIPNLLDRWDSDAMWLDVPQNYKGKKLNDHILNKLLVIKNKRSSNEF